MIELWQATKEPYLPSSEAADNIVLSGDSQTANDLWPPLFRSFLRGTIAAHNVAVSGKRLQALITDDVSRVDSIYVTGALNVCICWAGTNDLCYEDGTAEQLLADAETYCAARKAAGWRVFVGTVLPRGNAPDPTTYEARRVAYNAALRSDYSFADGLIDVAADSRIGAPGANTNATFFASESGAWVHINSAGGDIVANIAAREYQKIKRALAIEP